MTCRDVASSFARECRVIRERHDTEARKVTEIGSETIVEE